MGKGYSFWDRIEKQEKFVNEKMNSGDMDYLKGKYSDKQIKGYLRQEHCGTRKPGSNDYVLSRDIKSPSTSFSTKYKY